MNPLNRCNSALNRFWLYSQRLLCNGENIEFLYEDTDIEIEDFNIPYWKQIHETNNANFLSALETSKHKEHLKTRYTFVKLMFEQNSFMNEDTSSTIFTELVQDVIQLAMNLSVDWKNASRIEVNWNHASEQKEGDFDQCNEALNKFWVYSQRLLWMGEELKFDFEDTFTTLTTKEISEWKKINKENCASFERVIENSKHVENLKPICDYVKDMLENDTYASNDVIQHINEHLIQDVIQLAEISHVDVTVKSQPPPWQCFIRFNRALSKFWTVARKVLSLHDRYMSIYNDTSNYELETDSDLRIWRQSQRRNATNLETANRTFPDYNVNQTFNRQIKELRSIIGKITPEQDDILKFGYFEIEELKQFLGSPHPKDTVQKPEKPTTITPEFDGANACHQELNMLWRALQTAFQMQFSISCHVRYTVQIINSIETLEDWKRTQQTNCMTFVHAGNSAESLTIYGTQKKYFYHEIQGHIRNLENILQSISTKSNTVHVAQESIQAIQTMRENILARNFELNQPTQTTLTKAICKLTAIVERMASQDFQWVAST